MIYNTFNSFYRSRNNVFQPVFADSLGMDHYHCVYLFLCTTLHEVVLYLPDFLCPVGLFLVNEFWCHRLGCFVTYYPCSPVRQCHILNIAATCCPPVVFEISAPALFFDFNGCGSNGVVKFGLCFWFGLFEPVSDF